MSFKKKGLQAASGIVGAVATADMTRCIVGAANVAGCVVCAASAANVAGCVVIGATRHSARVLIFLAHAARLADTMLGAMTTVVASGIVSAVATALSGSTVTRRGAAA